MKRSAFFISDGTGITAETLGQSLLAQFENITFTKLTRPYIDNADKARAMVQQINKAAETDGFRRSSSTPSSIRTSVRFSQRPMVS